MGKTVYPLIDPRRASDLRRVLLSDAAAMAPFWKGAAEDKGADRALVEAAARLFEEATLRLDKTPQRDALAFLETFDIAPPKPVAATGLVAFALKKDKTRPVQAPAGTGLEVAARLGAGDAADTGKAAFETTDPLRIQPGRIDTVAVIDAVGDRIEIAPPAVTTLEPDLAARPRYVLRTDAPAGSDVIDVEPVEGLEKGNLLRIALKDGSAPVYVTIAEISQDGRLKLVEPLPDGGLIRDNLLPIQRHTSLDVLMMPNVQEHGFYIGDKDVLNVKEPAEFTLRFTPAPVAEALVRNGVRFEIFGTREPDPAPGAPEPVPDWHELVPLAHPGTDLILYKAWVGSVDEIKLSDKQEEASRWIRIVPTSPLTKDDKGSLIFATGGLKKITLGVETKLPEGASDDTISQVAHNGQPLSTASPFLPFGPEPLRFDAFALAAPEALTKPGAKVTLDFLMADATMLAVTQALRGDGERHVYGISRSGRLQVLDLTDTPVVFEIHGPAVEPEADKKLRLNPQAGLFVSGALTVKNKRSTDMVIAQSEAGSWYVTQVRFNRNVSDDASGRIELSASWKEIPALPADALSEKPDGSPETPVLGLAPERLKTDAYQAELHALTSNGFYRLKINSSGIPAENWTLLASISDVAPFVPGPSTRMVRIEDEDFFADKAEEAWNRCGFLIADKSGALWRYLIPVPNQPFNLTELGQQIAPDTSFAGYYSNDGNVFSYALRSGTTLGCLRASYDEPTDLSISKTQDLADAPNSTLKDVEVRFMPGLATSTTPALFGFYRGADGNRFFEWHPEQEAAGFFRTDTPPALDSAEGGAPFLLAGFGPRKTDTGAAVPGLALIAGASVSAIRLGVDATFEAQAVDDWISAPPASDSAFPIPVLRRETEVGTEVGTEVDLDPAPVAPWPTNNHPLSGNLVYKLPDDQTNWNAPVSLFQTEADTDEKGAVLETPDRIMALSGQTLDLEEGHLIILARKSASTLHRVFKVIEKLSAVQVRLGLPDGATSQFAVEFADLFDPADPTDTDALWRRLEPASEVLPADQNAHRNTLLELPQSPPPFAAPFATPATMAPLVELQTASGQNYAILDGWTEAPPATTLFKFAATANAMQTAAVMPLTGEYSNPKLSWEYFNGEGWKRLADDFLDKTDNFAATGQVTFRVPRDLSLTEIGGQDDFWIRTRLIGGDYGRPKYVVETSGNEQTITVVTSHMSPPEIMRLRASFKLEPVHAPGVLNARNNLSDIDVTGANGLPGAQIAMFRGLLQDPLAPMDDPEKGTVRTSILIGLTQPLATGTTTFLVKAEDQAPLPPVEVSVLGPDNNWSKAPLTDPDPTLGLSRSGLLSFQVPVEPAKVQLLGRTLHWVRLSLTPTGSDWPKINGLWLNGVPVLQATTITQEVIGSSTGEPNQSFQLLNAPILPDSLELRVRESLSAEEIERLRAIDAAAVLTDVPNLKGAWVRWHRVDSLIDAAPGARVFLADASGTLRFGTGEAGKLPLAAADNLRAFRYASGGARVETEDFAEASISATVEGLDVLLAPLAIAGGRDAPSQSELVDRMPDVLRHAGAGLSLSDIEALARDLDTEIAQVRAFAPETPKDPVLLAVLARGQSREPRYSQASQDALEKALRLVTSDAYGPACIAVTPVTFVALKVTVALVAKPGRKAELDTSASALLGTFLHPSKGGPEGAGWPPARPLRPTDLRRALAVLTDDLDRIEAIDILRTSNAPQGDIGPRQVITTASTRDIIISVTEAPS